MPASTVPASSKVASSAGWWNSSIRQALRPIVSYQRRGRAGTAEVDEILPAAAAVLAADEGLADALGGAVIIVVAGGVKASRKTWPMVAVPGGWIQIMSGVASASPQRRDMSGR